MPEVEKKSGTWKILLGVGIGCLVLGALAVVLVVALAFFGGRAVKVRAKQAQSMAAIMNVTMALESFQMDHAQYPWAAGSKIDPKEVCTELCGLPGAKVNKQSNKYMVPGPQSVQGGRLVDAWGNPLEFSLDAKGRPVIRSRGPDGMSGTADDITNG